MSIYQLAPVLGPAIGPIGMCSRLHPTAFIVLIGNSWWFYCREHDLAMGILVSYLFQRCHPVDGATLLARDLRAEITRYQSEETTPNHR